MPNVTRSRDSWRTSFIATARRRRNEAASLTLAMLVLARGHDEHVFEARMRALDARVDAMLAQLGAELLRGFAFAAIGQHAQPHAELRHAVHPRKLAQQARRGAAVGAL